MLLLSTTELSECSVDPSAWGPEYLPDAAHAGGIVIHRAPLPQEGAPTLTRIKLPPRLKQREPLVSYIHLGFLMRGPRQGRTPFQCSTIFQNLPGWVKASAFLVAKPRWEASQAGMPCFDPGVLKSWSPSMALRPVVSGIEGTFHWASAGQIQEPSGHVGLLIALSVDTMPRTDAFLQVLLALGTPQTNRGG